MTKDVLIKIKGLHSLDTGGDTDPIELITVDTKSASIISCMRRSSKAGIT